MMRSLSSSAGWLGLGWERGEERRDASTHINSRL